ncbi:MAG: DUF4905 domain-containing protein, partial [Thermoflexibacteraceae bacterium]
MLLQEYTLKFSSPIFRTLPSSEGNKLAVELRNAATQEVDFAVIDLNNAQYLLPETTLGTWRVGLAAIVANYLVISNFTESNYPDNKGVIVIDYLNANVVWDNPTYYYDELLINNNQEYVLKMKSHLGEAARIHYLDIATGEESNLPSVLQSLNNPLGYAQRYTPQQPFFSQMVAYLAQKTQEVPIELIDYLEWKDFFVIGYFITIDNKLIYKLLVFNAQKEIIQQTSLLLSHIHTPPPFIVCGDTLIILEDINT